MNKLKDTKREELMNIFLTKSEMDIFNVITRYQEDNGLVRGAYYKGVCDEASCSYPTFYSAIRGLEKKGIVELVHNKNEGDWDILILNNDFTGKEEDYKKGYLNMNHDIFFSKDFIRMTAIEKLLLMDLMRKCQKNSVNGGKYHVSLVTFYDTYTKQFKAYGKKGKLSKRVLQNCMKTLRKFFNIGIHDKKYWISPKDILFKQEEVENSRTEEGNLKKHLSKVIGRREKLDYTTEEMQDTINLLNTFRERFEESKVNPVESLFSAVRMSLEVINKGIDNIKKWKRDLVPSLVNKMICDRILGSSF